MALFRNLLQAFRPRVAGNPPSGNGASSFHLRWNITAPRLVEVSATLELLAAPVVDRLHFWALQVSFVHPDGGAAHLGLQHNKRYPNQRAVNWGGYAPKPAGGLLQGSPSSLPSTPNDPNTRDFDWKAGRPYRLTIARHSAGEPDALTAWRGSVTDLTTGRTTVVRELYSPGSYLLRPMVWTESFARCEHPSVVARWSQLSAIEEGGLVTEVTSVLVNYQSRGAGGCANTNIAAQPEGWVQTTNTYRATPQGATVSLL